MEYLFYGAIIYWLSFSIHELGHVIGIIFYGGRIRGTFLPLIKIYRDGNWKIKLRKKISSANVLIDVNSINSLQSYSNLRKLLLMELMMGPLFSIIYQLGLFVAIYIIIFCKIAISNVILFVIICGAVLNVSLLVNSFKDEKDNICDYNAYKKIKDSEICYQGYAIEYLMLSSNNILKIKNSTVLFDKLLNTLDDYDYINFENEDILYILYDYLTLYTAGYIEDNKIIAKSVHEIIEKLETFYDPSENIKVILLIRITQYLIINKEHSKANTIFQLYINNDILLENKMILYYIKQIKFMLNNDDDDSEFLLSKSNILNSLINKEYIVFSSTQQLYKDTYQQLCKLKEKYYG